MSKATQSSSLFNSFHQHGLPGMKARVCLSLWSIFAVLGAGSALDSRGMKTPGLKIVFGTDAVAAAHGRNAEEFVDRVRDGGMAPMAAMVSANSTGAEALGMADQIGSIAPGLQADIIALDGNPAKDITAEI